MTHAVTIPNEPVIEVTNVGGTPTDTFNFNFKFLDEAHVVCEVDGAVVTATITGVALGDGSGFDGGTAVLDTPISNATLAIIRNTTISRTSDIGTGGLLPIDTINDELDTLTAIQMEHDEALNRALVLSKEQTAHTDDLEIPPLEANKALVVNAAGDGFIFSEVDASAATLAAASAAAAAVSEAAAAASETAAGNSETAAAASESAAAASAAAAAQFGFYRNVVSVKGAAITSTTVNDASKSTLYRLEGDGVGGTLTLPEISTLTLGTNVWSIAVTRVDRISDGTITLARSGTDTFGVLGGATSLTLRDQDDFILLFPDSGTGKWNYVRGGVEQFRGCLATCNALTVISAAGLTPIDFQTESYDTDGIHSTSVNPSRLTVPAGVSKIRLKGKVGLANSALGTYRAARMMKNGTANFPGSGDLYTAVVSASISPVMTLESAVIDVVPGDYFELGAVQDTGGNLNTAFTLCWFSMEIVE